MPSQARNDSKLSWELGLLLALALESNLLDVNNDAPGIVIDSPTGNQVGTGSAGMAAEAAVPVRAELIAYEDGREVMRSRAIVGSGRTRTPQLSTFVTSARCNPPWYVPASLQPEIRANGAVGYRSVGSHLILPPGPTNPLGPIRIGLYDSDGIFLHGTSNPGLFARQNRALSHGCVRVERIRELTAWMVERPPAAVQAALASGRTLELIPPQEVHVSLAYLTAWPDSNGSLVAHADTYGLDVPGTRRAPHRRVARPAPQTPAEAEATASAAPPDGGAL